MASSRVIRKGLRSSEVIGKLSFKEIWLYGGLLFEADDYGLFEARSKSLRRDITGEKEDEFTVEEIEIFLQRASDLGLIILYEVDGRRYGWVQKFRQQVRAKQSLFPPPPGYVIRDKRLIAGDKHLPADDNHVIDKNEENDSVSELGGMSSTCTTNDNHLPTDDKHLPANVHLDEDEDEVKDEDEDEAHPLTPPPCTVKEVEAHLRAAAFSGCVRLIPDQIPDCALAYWGSRDAVNWTRKGIPVTKWRSDAVSFAVSYASNHPPPPENGDSDPFDPRFRKNI